MYFDVLFTCHELGNEDNAWYLVRTVRSQSQEAAVLWGKRKAKRVINPGQRGRYYSQRFWAVGHAGEFDKFIAKNVGQFIDESRIKEGR